MSFRNCSDWRAISLCSRSVWRAISFRRNSSVTSESVASAIASTMASAAGGGTPPSRMARACLPVSKVSAMRPVYPCPSPMEAMRSIICSGVTSSMCVAMVQALPAGSTMRPSRSP